MITVHSSAGWKQVAVVMLLMLVSLSSAYAEPIARSKQQEQVMLKWIYTGHLVRELSVSSADSFATLLERGNSTPLSNEERRWLTSRMIGTQKIEVQGTLEIARTQDAVVIRLSTTNPLIDLRTRTVSQKHTEFMIVCNPSHTLRWEAGEPLMQVYRPPHATLGYRVPIPQGVPSVYPFLPVDFEILCGTPLNELLVDAETSWRRVEGGWRLTTDLLPSQLFQIFRASSNKTLRVEVLDKGGKIVQERVYRVGKLVNNTPEEFQVELKLRNLSGKVEFKLIQRSQESFEPKFDKNLVVEDYRLVPYEEVIAGRLGQAVRYQWTGLLPSEEKLRQLAYEQGQMTIPYRGSNRRASLWLFIPALVFFALAAYFYFKGKRR